MTMYKPGTQLIINKLWAADAAENDQGFKVQSSTRAHTVPGLIGESIWVQRFMEMTDKWRITVTESGPNAAERFLPQLDDYVEWTEGDVRCVCADDLGATSERLIPLFFARMYSHDQKIRIIERNGIPFPQFSEVIES